MDWAHNFLNDSRHALRSLMRAPAFSAAAVLTMALGVGVNTAVFRVVYATLLEPLPFRSPGRLVHVAETHPEFPSFQVAAPDYFDWRARASSFEQLAAHTFQEMNKWTLVGEGEPEPVHIVQAAHELFPMLGVEPIAGRSFTAEEERRKAAVVVLSESLWRRKFGANPAVVGRTIRLARTPVTVVGVVSQRQAYPVWADIWMPISHLDPALTATRRFHALEVLGRLKPGVSIETAQAEMRTIAGSLTQEHPDTNGKVGAAVLPLSLWMTGEVRPPLLIAWAAVSLVLLLACANVAHLVMVRSVARSREMAVRAALGASSGRLARFLLAENLAIAGTAGVIGWVLAQFTMPALATMASQAVPGIDAGPLPAGTMWFAAAATILSALLFALPAVIEARRLDLYQAIKQSSGVSMSQRRSRFGGAIIAAEVALSFVVVTGAGLLYRSFASLVAENTGIQPRGVISAEVPLIADDWPSSARMFEEVLAPRLRTLPGVALISAVNCGPMSLSPTEVSRFATRFAVPGQPLAAGQFPVAQSRWVTMDYFETLGIPLASGRLFTAADAGKPGFIINEALARRFFPNQDPVGRQLLMNVVSAKPDSIPIIGVVRDVRDLAYELEPRPTIYTLAVSPRMTVLVRANGDLAGLIPAVRNAIRAANPDAAVTTIAPLEKLIRNSVGRRRFALDLLGVFAGLAALLTAIGVYGVVAYSLSRRTGEFAIRFALGAGKGDVRRLILGNLAVPTASGLGAGLGMSWLFAQVLRTQLYKLSSADPAVLLLSGVALLLLVLGSAWRPAVKAASISPSAALRE